MLGYFSDFPRQLLGKKQKNSPLPYFQKKDANQFFFYLALSYDNKKKFSKKSIFLW